MFAKQPSDEQRVRHSAFSFKSVYRREIVAAKTDVDEPGALAILPPHFLAAGADLGVFAGPFISFDFRDYMRPEPGAPERGTDAAYRIVGR